MVGWVAGWLGGWVGGFFQEIFPLRGSILQAGTCQILRLAETPRRSRVWQYPLAGTTWKDKEDLMNMENEKKNLKQRHKKGTIAKAKKNELKQVWQG